MKIWVVMATYNRSNLTERCLKSVARAARRAQTEVQVVVFDDGSTDGTPDVVRRTFPQAIVLEGDGRNFWARSMESAERLARAKAAVDDVLLWLNDDVVLDPGALRDLRELAAEVPGRVLVGATRSSADGTVTYSGYVRVGANPLRLDAVVPAGVPTPVDTFNGNLVWVPWRASQTLGGLDGKFSHAFADIDYGLRLKGLGTPAILAPEPLGICDRNPPRSFSSVSEAWTDFTSVKGGGNFASLKRFHRRHSGRWWLVRIGLTYARFWQRAIPQVLAPGRRRLSL